MAENKENQEVKQEPTGSPADNAAAQETGKPAETIDEKDIANVIAVLNEMNKISGGTGDITELPPQLLGVTKFLIEKMSALRDAFEDPLFKAVLDDMVDQREDGQTPSLLVAVARNVSLEELQNLADGEDYAGIQESLRGQLDKAESDRVDEEALYAKFDKSKANVEAYCKKMGYDQARTKTLWDGINLLRDVFADGEITEAEAEKIDKMQNYDADMSNLRTQLPENPVKTVLPDKASMSESMEPKPAVKTTPSNSIEAMAAAMPTQDYTQTGKRKFVK